MGKGSIFLLTFLINPIKIVRNKHLIQRGKETGPMKPQQPQTILYGANSSRT
jgi:hypothetical protein